MQMDTTLSDSRSSISAPATCKRFGRKRLLLVGFALILIGAGLVWQWGWLAAIGIAPFLLSAAPCVAMCALGLCMRRSGQNGGVAPTNNAQSSSPQQET